MSSCRTIHDLNQEELKELRQAISQSWDMKSLANDWKLGLGNLMSYIKANRIRKGTKPKKADKLDQTKLNIPSDVKVPTPKEIINEVENTSMENKPETKTTDEINEAKGKMRLSLYLTANSLWDTLFEAVNTEMPVKEISQLIGYSTNAIYNAFRKYEFVKGYHEWCRVNNKRYVSVYSKDSTNRREERRILRTLNAGTKAVKTETKKINKKKAAIEQPKLIDENIQKQKNEENKQQETKVETKTSTKEKENVVNDVNMEKRWNMVNMPKDFAKPDEKKADNIEKCVLKKFIQAFSDDKVVLESASSSGVFLIDKDNPGIQYPGVRVTVEFLDKEFEFLEPDGTKRKITHTDKVKTLKRMAECIFGVTDKYIESAERYDELKAMMDELDAKREEIANKLKEYHGVVGGK